MTRLLAFLLEREDTFHEIFLSEHTFGCLNDKRISLLDPYQWAELIEIYNVIPRANAMKDDLPIPNVLFDWTDPTNPIHVATFRYRLRLIYGLLWRHQLDLREIFEYRQVVEWGFKPLWHQLYTPVSPELGVSDSTIDQFLEWTSLNHLTNNIFTVKPIRSDRFDGTNCPICMENLGTSVEIQGKMVAELKCGHFFHTECIIRHFDEFNKWQNRCPICRQSAGSLRSMVDGVFLEAMDVDYDLPSPQREGQSIHDEIHANEYEQSLRDLSSVMDFGPDYQNAYWQRHLYRLLETRRERRQANHPAIDAFYYGT